MATLCARFDFTSTSVLALWEVGLMTRVLAGGVLVDEAILRTKNLRRDIVCFHCHHRFKDVEYPRLVPKVTPSLQCGNCGWMIPVEANE